jgi:hypothetical protein
MKFTLPFAMNSVLVVGAALFVVGCQTVPYQGNARDVKRKPGVGGTVAVPLNPRQEDRDRANEHMISNCGNGNYKVSEEGEVVIGETTSADTRNDYRQNNQVQTGSFLGMPIVSGDPGGTDSHINSTRSQLKEWQLTYECNTATTAPAPAPVPVAPKAKPKAKKHKA